MGYAKRIADTLRAIAPDGILKADEVPLIDAIATKWDARSRRPASEPLWVVAGKTKLGEREVPGPRHNPWILSFWKQAPWLKTDDADSPWCGGFVKWCMEQAGLPYPKLYPRAASWAEYGTATKACVGAIGVKARKGGNHVFIIVGETPDKRFFKVLEGNANNMVRIGDVAKSDVTAIRWPPGAPPPAIGLPVMPAGAISSSEA